MGNQQPNVSKYARSVSNGFLCALEARLANLEGALSRKFLEGFFVSSESVG